ncbi:energy transducer TonB [candidate division KSB1 bacterium]|nr:energy transducer TonB [candidate division KSB1 bacterium]NIR69339.1 energy transducer TonB [candidate division KSB1 bacterium]NIS24157.1 energy transducer TonB [candidate division KSB1 bacterium]NIT71072.1 energy transducer TonB [candidate division KSB1 bacterium]NIU24776.1 energy transducer TonB [candidate division KSB1 bacterium]
MKTQSQANLNLEYCKHLRMALFVAIFIQLGLCLVSAQTNVEGTEVKSTHLDVPKLQEEPPEPIGGYEAIRKRIQYPKLAREIGIEGFVVVGVLIDEYGNPQATQVRKGEGFTGFEMAVQKALKAVRWQPAKQRGRAVKVWIWVPVQFKLHDVESDDNNLVVSLNES